MARSPPAAASSTRRITRDTGRFTRTTPGSQSLERGLHLLRAFRPGVGALTNAQLSKNSGLARATVSRLTRSLVDAGFLAYDVQESAYRLTAACLSLALAFESDNAALRLAMPLMRETASTYRINVGMAVADQLEMVYLHSVRQKRAGVFRRIVTGARVPMELTSLGRAHLSQLAEPVRSELMSRLASERGPDWPATALQIQRAVAEVQQLGYCVAMWQPGMVAMAAPIATPAGQIHAVNLSFPIGDDDVAAHVQQHAPTLILLVAGITAAWKAGLS